MEDALSPLEVPMSGARAGSEVHLCHLVPHASLLGQPLNHLLTTESPGCCGNTGSWLLTAWSLWDAHCTESRVLESSPAPPDPTDDLGLMPSQPWISLYCQIGIHCPWFIYPKHPCHCWFRSWIWMSFDKVFCEHKGSDYPHAVVANYVICNVDK